MGLSSSRQQRCRAPRMPSYFTIFSATLPVFLVMGIGFLFHRRGWLGEEVEVGVMKLGLNLLFPCFILSIVPGNPALETISSSIWAIGTGFALIVAALLRPSLPAANYSLTTPEWLTLLGIGVLSIAAYFG